MISLEVAKELKKISEEKGVELPDSTFTYLHIQHTNEYAVMLCRGKTEIPAYNLEELLEILSNNHRCTSTEVCSTKHEDKIEWLAWFNTECENNYASADTPADAAGKLLIELIKHNKL